MKSFNEALTRFDPLLVAKRDLTEAGRGMIVLFRKVKRWESVESRGVKYTYSKTVETPVLYLTSNWGRTGVPVDYGITRTLERLQEIDAFNRVAFFESMERMNEEAKTLRQKSLHGTITDSVKEHRDAFVKATWDVNLGTVNKRKRN